jgi:hypothetical protein
MPLFDARIESPIFTNSRAIACKNSLRIPKFVYGIGTEEVIRVGGPRHVSHEIH